MDAFVQKAVAFVKANLKSFAVAVAVFFLVNFLAPSEESFTPFLAGAVAFFVAKYLVLRP